MVIVMFSCFSNILGADCRQDILDIIFTQGDQARVVITIHYHDVIMSMMAFQITSLTIVNSSIYSDAEQRKHQSSALLAFVRGIHRSPVNSPHKWPVTRKENVSIWWRHHDVSKAMNKFWVIGKVHDGSRKGTMRCCFKSCWWHTARIELPA